MIRLARAYRRYDPASRSLLEVLFLYPGIRALFFHRVAHFLFCLRVPFVPRLISELSRFFSGIEIHPGARLGRVLIDHGMGVVIGETAVIGDDVLLYQGVTLGGTTLSRGRKRHPTVENDAIIGSGAKVLGDITIGQGARIGANSVVLESVPARATAAGIPARLIQNSPQFGTPDFVI